MTAGANLQRVRPLLGRTNSAPVSSIRKKHAAHALFTRSRFQDQEGEGGTLDAKRTRSLALLPTSKLRSNTYRASLTISRGRTTKVRIPGRARDQRRPTSLRVSLLRGAPRASNTRPLRQGGVGKRQAGLYISRVYCKPAVPRLHSNVNEFSDLRDSGPDSEPATPERVSATSNAADPRIQSRIL
jgi:hypothetical protein